MLSIIQIFRNPFIYIKYYMGVDSFLYITTIWFGCR